MHSLQCTGHMAIVLARSPPKWANANSGKVIVNLSRLHHDVTVNECDEVDGTQYHSP